MIVIQHVQVCVYPVPEVVPAAVQVAQAVQDVQDVQAAVLTSVHGPVVVHATMAATMAVSISNEICDA